jgi:hypothetical protein
MVGRVALGASRHGSGQRRGGETEEGKAALDAVQSEPGEPVTNRAEVEQATGSDLRSARVHTSPAAVEAAPSARDHAYRYGDSKTMSGCAAEPEMALQREICAAEERWEPLNRGPFLPTLSDSAVPSPDADRALPQDRGSVGFRSITIDSDERTEVYVLRCLVRRSCRP